MHEGALEINPNEVNEGVFDIRKEVNESEEAQTLTAAGFEMRQQLNGVDNFSPTAENLLNAKDITDALAYPKGSIG
jgi:hypothetical protein